MAANAINDSGRALREAIANAEQLAYQRQAAQQQARLGQQRIQLGHEELLNKRKMLEYYNQNLAARQGMHKDRILEGDKDRVHAQAQQLRGALSQFGPDVLPMMQQPSDALLGTQIDPKAVGAGGIRYAANKSYGQAAARGSAQNKAFADRRLGELKGREAAEAPAQELPGPLGGTAPLSARLPPGAIAPGKATGLDQGTWNVRENVKRITGNYRALQNKLARGDRDYEPSPADYQSVREYISLKGYDQVDADGDGEISDEEITQHFFLPMLNGKGGL